MGSNRGFLSRTTSATRRQAFSLIELIVVMAIIGLLAALVLTAVQSAREASRRTACASNLRNVGLALTAYDGANGQFPPGSKGFSFHIDILPYLEQSSLAASIKGAQTEGMFVSQQSLVLVPVLICPSDDGATIYGKDGQGTRPVATNYHGNYGTGYQKFGYNGAFARTGINAGVTRGMFGDGLSRTATVSEVLVGNGSTDALRTVWETKEPLIAPEQLNEFATRCLQPDFRVDSGNNWGWGRPWTRWELVSTLYNHVITPNNPPCANGKFLQQGAYPPSSNHLGAVNVLFADGHWDLVSEDVSLHVWRDLGSRN